MQNILFKVGGQRIESTSDVVVVAKSKHEYKAVFSFSSEWEALENKVAYFKTPKLKEPVFVELQDNECEIPVEALETPYFTVSVAAGDLRTATVCDVVVEETGYSDAAEPALSPKGRRRYADSLILNGKQLQLTEAGTPIGDIVTIPDFDKFELWNDITLEDDVLNISITKTDSGAPIKVKKLVLVFVGQIADDGYLMLRNNESKFYQVYSPINKTSKNSIFWAETEKISDGIYISKYTSSLIGVDKIGDIDNININGAFTKSSIVSSLAMIENPSGESEKTMTSIHFGGLPATPNCKLVAGSRILVWGVQDDD